jgi:3-oxoacyl-[acyl-carrier protein] reductase
VVGVAITDLEAALKKLKPDFSPHRVVVVPRKPATTSLSDLAAEDFIGTTEEALVGAETAARYLLNVAPAGQARRLVLLSGWAVMGLPRATTASAVMGGMIGLAKSWALELGPEGITVNAIVAGAGVDGSDWEKALPPIGHHPTNEEIAHAVTFFLDERSGGVNGQVLFVCGGLTPGIIPS